MKLITKIAIRIREWHSGLNKGQTMTEYAMIMFAVAVVVFITYQTMGNDIRSLVSGVGSDVASAS
jgi:Flp pilus assembly pilin Flp